MLGSKTVLIVDENGYAALDLSEAIVESDGRVAGPAATLSETLTILHACAAPSSIASLPMRLTLSCCSRNGTFLLLCRSAGPCRMAWGI